jgi:hypothetical protein
MRSFARSIAVSVVAFGIGVTLAAEPQEAIKPSEAGAHAGKHRTVCGRVASASFVPGRTGRPTFLNLDRPHPHQIFTVLIWGRNRAKFPSPPEQLYRNTQICVSGVIDAYKGLPQIVVDDPSQISLR